MKQYNFGDLLKHHEGDPAVFNGLVRELGKKSTIALEEEWCLWSLLYCFSWDETPEGREFWVKVFHKTPAYPGYHGAGEDPPYYGEY